MAVFGLVMWLGARYGVDAGFFRGFGGLGTLGSSGYLDLLGLPIPNSLLKKQGLLYLLFFSSLLTDEVGMRAMMM